MSQSIKLSKRAATYWLHTITKDGQISAINDPDVSILMANNVLSISVGLDSINKIYQNFEISEVIVQDDSTGGGEETFTTLDALSARLAVLDYVGFRTISGGTPMTGAEIKALYEVQVSAFTDALFTKLAGIEAGATTDQTGAEIKALYEVEVSAFTDALFTKLAGIEAGATTDQTGAEIKALYEVQVSAFTDALFTKLAGIEAGADVTDAANVSAAGALLKSGGVMTGALEASNHGTPATDEVINVCYGTSATPPTASTTTEGALYIQYTA